MTTLRIPLDRKATPVVVSPPQPVLSLRQQPRADDRAAIREICASTNFFSIAEIEVAIELLDDRLQAGDRSDYHFLFADLDDRLVGFASFGEIACTVGSYDLYWIAVHRDHQGSGVGKQLLGKTEELIATRGGRQIYIETSSRPLYEPTQAFYLRRGYRVAGIFEDFYAPGDGKVTLVKTIG